MKTNTFYKLHFESGKPEAEEACSFCKAHYGQYDLEKANVHVVLGGDGSVLNAIHQQITKGVNLPVFGLNFGTYGWMCNTPDLKNIPTRIQEAQPEEILPLKMTATSAETGKIITAYAVNEFSVLRDSPQAVHLLVSFKDKDIICNRLSLEGDGLILATPIGSTGYYANIGGQKITAPEKGLGLRSINAKKTLDLLLSERAKIAVNKLQGQKRPMMIEGDGQRFSNISRAVISSAFDKKKILLFDKVNQRNR